VKGVKREVRALQMEEDEESEQEEQKEDEAVPMDEDQRDTGAAAAAAGMGTCEIAKVTTLRGHESEVFIVMWDPSGTRLATG
jgi:hypothetical protein